MNDLDHTDLPLRAPCHDLPTMGRADLLPGDVLFHPFIWSWQARIGDGVAQKRRPCVVLYRFSREGTSDEVVLLPISSRPPAAGEDYIAVPEAEQMRIGLDSKGFMSVMLNDVNRELIGPSITLPTIIPIRRLSPEFMNEVNDTFYDVLQQRRVAAIQRFSAFDLA